MHAIYWVCMCMSAISSIKNKNGDSDSDSVAAQPFELTLLCAYVCIRLHLTTGALNLFCLKPYAHAHNHTKTRIHRHTHYEETETAIETKQFMQTHTHARTQMSRFPFESTWKRFALPIVCDPFTIPFTYLRFVNFPCAFCTLYFVCLKLHTKSPKKMNWNFLIHFNSTQFLNSPSESFIWIYALHLPCFEYLVAFGYWPLDQKLMKIMIWSFHVDFRCR